MNVEYILARKGREVRTITPDASLEDALQRLRAERIGALVVSTNGEEIAGVASCSAATARRRRHAASQHGQRRPQVGCVVQCNATERPMAETVLPATPRPRGRGQGACPPSLRPAPRCPILRAGRPEPETAP